MDYFLGYFLVINILGAGVVIWDKSAAKRKKRRIPEKTLWLLSIFGASFAMLLTMWLFRHKTKHLRFMLGIPAILLLQLIVFFWLKTQSFF
jgi:uncharacterized membrane protein YsdA (DUF1294 family)